MPNDFFFVMLAIVGILILTNIVHAAGWIDVPGWTLWVCVYGAWATFSRKGVPLSDQQPYFNLVSLALVLWPIIKLASGRPCILSSRKFFGSMYRVQKYPASTGSSRILWLLNIGAVVCLYLGARLSHAP